MSQRSDHLRDQAAKCEAHARSRTAPDTQAELRKLAAQYVEQADHTEGNEVA